MYNNINIFFKYLTEWNITCPVIVIIHICHTTKEITFRKKFAISY